MVVVNSLELSEEKKMPQLRVGHGRFLNAFLGSAWPSISTQTRRYVLPYRPLSSLRPASPFSNHLPSLTRTTYWYDGNLQAAGGLFIILVVDWINTVIQKDLARMWNHVSSRWNNHIIQVILWLDPYRAILWSGKKYLLSGHWGAKTIQT